MPANGIHEVGGSIPPGSTIPAKVMKLWRTDDSHVFAVVA